MADVELSILQRVRNFLQIEGDASGIELFQLLKQYRNDIHPDKVKGEEAKKAAEEQFKQAQDLLRNLTNFLEQERLARKPTELAFYSQAYDAVNLQSELDEISAERTRLQQENDSLRDELKALTEVVSESQNKALRKETDEIKEIYKPSKANLASLGIVVLLTSASAVMVKMEEVSNFLKKYSPIDERTLNKSLFFLCLIVITLTVKRFIEYHWIKHKIHEASSAAFSMKFMELLNSTKKWEKDYFRTFTETDVVAFLEDNLCKRRKWLEILGFRLFSIETVESLKNFFIHTLLSKKLIEISSADSLDRTFVIKSGNWRYFTRR